MGVGRCGVAARRAHAAAFQLLQGRGAPVRLNRRYMCALSGAGLVLAALLLLSAARSGEEASTLADAGLAWLRRSRDARRYVRPLTSTALLTPPPAAAAAAACAAPAALAFAPAVAQGGVGVAEAPALAATSALPAEPFRLLMMVTSAPAHAGQRQAIRETWGGRSEDAKLVFFLGRDPEPAAAPSAAVEEEAREHGDIVVEDFTDSYQNLTLKTLFMLKWALRECPGAAFVLKTDDDMLVHTRGLVRALPKWVAAARGQAPPVEGEEGGGDWESDAEAPPLVMGFRYHRVLPYRDAASKWFLPRWLFPDDELPDFVSGTAYVLSRAALERVYSAALDTPLLPLEDVFLTGVVAGERLRLPRVHISRFSANGGMMPMPSALDHPCMYHHLLTAHQFSPERLRRTWRALVHLNPKRDCGSALMRLRGRLFAAGDFQVVSDDPW